MRWNLQVGVRGLDPTLLVMKHMREPEVRPSRVAERDRADEDVLCFVEPMGLVQQHPQNSMGLAPFRGQGNGSAPCPDTLLEGLTRVGIGAPVGQRPGGPGVGIPRIRLESCGVDGLEYTPGVDASIVLPLDR